jgi:hypothetical protein
MGHSPRHGNATQLSGPSLVREAFVVDRADFLAALSGQPETGNRVSRAALERLDTPPEGRLLELDHDAELTGRPVAELLAAPTAVGHDGVNALRELADAARVVAVPDAAPITREGDYGCSYCVILEGAAQVFEDGTPVNDRGPRRWLWRASDHA